VLSLAHIDAGLREILENSPFYYREALTCLDILRVCYLFRYNFAPATVSDLSHDNHRGATTLDWIDDNIYHRLLSYPHNLLDWPRLCKTDDRNSQVNKRMKLYLFGWIVYI